VLCVMSADLHRTGPHAVALYRKSTAGGDWRPNSQLPSYCGFHTSFTALQIDLSRIRQCSSEATAFLSAAAESHTSCCSAGEEDAQHSLQQQKQTYTEAVYAALVRLPTVGDNV
jgi:hypothetical protein